MPAYNAAKYIGYAIESVLSQTYTDWELLIVDDKSTDKTLEIILKYACKDSRIKVHQLEENSGSAQRPRLTAERLAQGAFICQLDADDTIENMYLEKLVKRQIETGADAVIGRLCRISQSGQKSHSFNPASHFDITSVISGKDAFMKTVGSWEINGLGIFKREILEDIPNDKIIDSINADEVYTRKKFLLCSVVAFCDADYYYRDNSESITNKFSLKLFDSLDAINDVRVMTLNEFDRNSKEYLKAVSHHFSSILNFMNLFLVNIDKIDFNNRLIIKNKIYSNWNHLSVVDVFNVSLKKGIAYSCGFHIIFIILSIRNYVKRK